MNRIALLPLLVFPLFVGCSTSASLNSWRSGVERYVNEQGNGDPGVLRDMTLTDGRKGFSVIGGAAPKGSTDANALLLGHRAIGGRGWFVYLVGLVKDENVEDVRLAAVSFEPTGQAKWVWGKEDDEAVKAYRSQREQAWKQRLPGRQQVPGAYMGFPGMEDAFELNLNGAEVVTRHEGSGAQWEMTVTER